MKRLMLLGFAAGAVLILSGSASAHDHWRHRQMRIEARHESRAALRDARRAVLNVRHRAYRASREARVAARKAVRDAMRDARFAIRDAVRSARRAARDAYRSW